jgi:uncharacterized protein (TIGR03437 family)
VKPYGIILFFFFVNFAFDAQISGVPAVIAGWSRFDPANAGDGLPAETTALGSNSGLAIAADGSVMLAGNGKLRRIGADGRLQLLAQAAVIAPTMAVSRQGDVYFAGTSEIDKVAASSYASGPTTAYERVAGGGTLAPQEGLRATAVALGASGLALDPSGLLVFTWAARVWRIDSAGVLHVVAGTGTAGVGGVGGPAGSLQFQSPAALAFDAAGILHILDGNRILTIAPDGTTRAAPLGTGTGVMALDSTGNAYFQDKYQVKKLSPAGGITLVAGTGDDGFSNGCGPFPEPNVGDAKTAQFGTLSSMAVDATGGLLVVDSSRNVVRRITPTGQVRTIAGAPPGFSGDGGPASAATLSGPHGVAYDPAGSLLIADTRNNRIRKITPDGLMQTVAGQGGPTADMTYSCSGSDERWLLAPEAAAADAAGNLYIADTGKHRIVKIAPNGALSRFAGTGVAGYAVTSIGARADAVPLDSPRAIGVDRAGNVYVGDSARRTLKIGTDGAVADVFPRLRARSFSTDPQGNLYLSAGFVSYLVNSDGALLPMAGLGQGQLAIPPPSTPPAPLVEEPDADDLRWGAGLARDAQGVIYNIGPNYVHLISPGCHVTQTTVPQAAVFGTYAPGPVFLASSPQGDADLSDSGDDVLWRLPHLTSDTGETATPQLAAGAPVRNAGSQTVLSTDSYISGPLSTYLIRTVESEPIAPGEIVRITGQCLGPIEPAQAKFDANGRLPTALGGVRVTFGGLAAPLITAQQGGLTAIVPLGFEPGKNAAMVVNYGGGQASETEVVAAYDPGLFRFLELDSSATAAAINQDGTINSQAHPAPAGSIVALYATGLGQTTPPGSDGEALNDLGAKYGADVRVTVNGIAGELLYAGPAPGFAGLTQINVRIPRTSTGPVQVLIGSAPFRQPVQIWVM